MFEEIRKRFFPAQLSMKVKAQPVKAEMFWVITAKLDREIETPFSELGLFEMPRERQQRAESLREIYLQSHHEHFVFYAEGGRPIGWSYGHMSDESTFFMSWSAVLPAYQRRGIYTEFLKIFLPYLHDLGYERVTSKHMVNNRPVLIAKLKAGFHVVGFSLDERFGAQVTLAYFFHEDRREGFATAFSLEHYAPPPEYRP